MVLSVEDANGRATVFLESLIAMAEEESNVNPRVSLAKYFELAGKQLDRGLSLTNDKPLAFVHLLGYVQRVLKLRAEHPGWSDSQDCKHKERCVSMVMGKLEGLKATIRAEEIERLQKMDAPAPAAETEEQNVKGDSEQIEEANAKAEELLELFREAMEKHRKMIFSKIDSPALAVETLRLEYLDQGLSAISPRTPRVQDYIKEVTAGLDSLALETSAPSAPPEPQQAGEYEFQWEGLSGKKSSQQPVRAVDGGSSSGTGHQKVQRFNVYGDGHCLYRSIAIAQNRWLLEAARNRFGVLLDRNARDEEMMIIKQIRAVVADHIETNISDFPTIIIDELPQRLAQIRGCGWGGEEELVAISHVVKRHVVIQAYRSALACGPPQVYEQGGETGGPPIVLCYTRNDEAAVVSGDPESGGHYDLLVFD